MHIVENFKDIVERFGSKVALCSDYEGEMTYQELDLYANYISFLVDKSMDSNIPIVGICLHRSFKMIAAMLGVMQAGYAYIPIDPTYPKERIEYYLEKSKVHHILCDKDTIGLISDGFSKIEVLNYTSIKSETVPKVEWKPKTDLAYIQYTSGSTGNPRGVMIEHKSIMNTLHWCMKYYGLSERDVALQIPSYAFASSVEDIYSTLLSGGTLVLIRAKDLLKLNYLKHLIFERGITHFIMVPSLYREFVSCLKGNSTLRFITIAGESFDSNLIERHYASLPNTSLYNEYGMTETSVACFAMKLDSNSIPNTIGKLLPNMEACIISPDEEGVGELYVGGTGIALGYHHDSEGTVEKFVALEEGKFFRTGDYVKQAEDGNFVHMGRRDKQIKVSGQRVNLTEIDNVLNSLPDVVCASSTLVTIKDNLRIVTFVQSENKNPNYFKKQIAVKLPEYYMPNFIQVVEQFEYLPNRKINLRKMGERFMEKYQTELLLTHESVQKLVAIFKECTDEIVTSVDLTQDVRKLGLSSIQFIQFVAQIEEEFSFEFGYDDLDNMEIISIKNLFEYIKEIEG